MLSLALGIGANTVVFSVLNALVLKPLPVAEPERIHFVNDSGRPPNSFPNYRDIRDRDAVFKSLFSYRIIQMALDDTTARIASGDIWSPATISRRLASSPAWTIHYPAAEDAHRDASRMRSLATRRRGQNRFREARPWRKRNCQERTFGLTGVRLRYWGGSARIPWHESVCRAEIGCP